MRGIASFYASRAVRQAKTAVMEEGYGMLNVMGPDEFHPNVNNSGAARAAATHPRARSARNEVVLG